MAKIIDFKNKKVVAELESDRLNPKRMSRWEFRDDEHDLQFTVYAIAWDALEAKLFLDEVDERYRAELDLARASNSKN